MATSITGEALATALAITQVIDVRRRPAFDASAALIATATWRDPLNVTRWAGELDPGRPVVVYCVHGHEVSQGCADILADAGLDVRYLAGGFEDWVSEGRLTTSSASK